MSLQIDIHETRPGVRHASIGGRLDTTAAPTLEAGLDAIPPGTGKTRTAWQHGRQRSYRKS